MAVVSLGVVASGSITGAVGGSTLAMPFLTNIPRSDASLGATLIFVFATISIPVGSSGISIASIADDADPDPYYGDCYFTNELNQYSGNGPSGSAYNQGGAPGGVTVDFNQPLRPAGVFPFYVFGCAFNPIQTFNSLTLTISGSGSGSVNAFAVAYTGVQFTSGHSVDTPLSFWRQFVSSGGFYGDFLDVADSRTNVFSQWSYNESVTHGQPYNTGPVGPPFIRAPWLPGTTVYPNWEIVGPGDLIVYTLADLNHGSAWPGSGFPSSGPYGDYDTGSSGGWTWGGAGPSTINEFDDFDGNGDGMLASLLVAEQPLGGAAPIVGQDITGSWGGIAPIYTVAGAFTLQAGPGPAQCLVPPPPGNGPLLNHRFRAA